METRETRGKWKLGLGLVISFSSRFISTQVPTHIERSTLMSQSYGKLDVEGCFGTNMFAISLGGGLFIGYLIDVCGSL